MTQWRRSIGGALSPLAPRARCRPDQELAVDERVPASILPTGPRVARTGATLRRVSADAAFPADTRGFARMIVHELRTPLTVAMSHAEMLAEAGEEFDAATRAEMAHDLLASIQRLSALVDSLAARALENR
jgi:signal transduction histidine kinase